MSYGKIGLTTVAVPQDLLSGMPLVLKIELICLWNSLLPEPGQPSAQLSKLVRLTACKKTMHAISRWYRTVYVTWLVASYDTYKGKRWLNSNTPNHRGQNASPLRPTGAKGRWYCSNHVPPNIRFPNIKFGWTKCNGNVIAHLPFELCGPIRIIIWNFYYGLSG